MAADLPTMKREAARALGDAVANFRDEVPTEAYTPEGVKIWEEAVADKMLTVAGVPELLAQVDRLAQCRLDRDTALEAVELLRAQVRDYEAALERIASYSGLLWKAREHAYIARAALSPNPDTIGQIDVDPKGRLRWHEDGTLLPTCADCGSQGGPDFHVPDAVWERVSRGDPILCWGCFVVRLSPSPDSKEE